MVQSMYSLQWIRRFRACIHYNGLDGSEHVFITTDYMVHSMYSLLLDSDCSEQVINNYGSLIVLNMYLSPQLCAGRDGHPW